MDDKMFPEYLEDYGEEEILEEYDCDVELSSDENETFFSTMPIPTYDKNNRLDYVAVMKDYNSGDEELQKDAAEKMIGELTGLIINIIKRKYPSYAPKHFEDMLQVGEMGVLIGLKDYDPTKSLPATFFIKYIIHEIQTYIDENVYRTTPYYSSIIKKINKAIAKFENENIPYTKRDIAIQTNLSLDTIEKTMVIMNGKNSVSLDSIGEQSSSVVATNPEEEFFKNESSEAVYRVLKACLTQEETLIISYLYGLGDLPVTSLKRIAEKMNCPIDRVKKLKTSAFCKLKNSQLSEMCSFGFKNDLIELDDEDSVSFFPAKEAKDSATEMENIEIQ